MSGPAGPPLTSVAITHLDTHFDEKKPLFIGHELPLRIGITSKAPSALLDPVEVQITLGLVEALPADATEEQAAAAAACFVRSTGFMVDGSGKEQFMEIPGIVIPNECLPAGRDTVTYNFTVQFDQEEKKLPPEFPRLVYFTESEKANPASAGCSSKTQSKTGDGCVHTLIVQKNPGFDVDQKVAPNGKLAIFWQKPVGGTEKELHSMMAVKVDLRANGADPLTLTPEGVQLEGTLTERIRIAPAEGPFAGQFQPVLIQAAAAADPPVLERVYDKMNPAAENAREYELFPTDAIRDLVMTGDWKGVDDFTVEVCVHSSIETHDVEGDSEEEPDEETDTKHADCNRFSVLGVRALPAASNGSRVEMGAAFQKQFGNDTAKLEIAFTTQNSVAMGAAVSQTDASIKATSNYLPDLELIKASAYAGFDLSNADKGGVLASLDVLGNRVYSFENKVPNSKVLLSEEKTFAEERCKSARFQAGPVPISVEGCIRGSAGVKIEVGLYRDAAITERKFPDATTEGQLAVTATPSIQVGATLKAGVDVVLFKAGIEGTATVVDLKLPLVAAANVGLVTTDPAAPTATTNLSATWKVEITPLTGSVNVFFDAREIKFCSKNVFFKKINYPCGLSWNRKGLFSLFSFKNDPLTETILERSLEDEVLTP